MKKIILFLLLISSLCFGQYRPGGGSGGGGGGSGTVTSVAMTVPSGFSVSGSPITTSGTLGVTLAAGTFLVPSDSTTSRTYSDSRYALQSTTLSIAGTSPLSSSAGAQNLGSNRVWSLSIADAVADGSTKGASTFTASDFNSSSGNISLDYTNGQKATSSVPGFLSSTDWSTFNNKGSGTVTNVSSANANITIVNPTTTPALTTGKMFRFDSTGSLNGSVIYDTSKMRIKRRPHNTYDASFLVGDSVGISLDGDLTYGIEVVDSGAGHSAHLIFAQSATQGAFVSWVPVNYFGIGNPPAGFVDIEGLIASTPVGLCEGGGFVGVGNGTPLAAFHVSNALNATAPDFQLDASNAKSFSSGQHPDVKFDLSTGSLYGGGGDVSMQPQVYFSSPVLQTLNSNTVDTAATLYIQGEPTTNDGQSIINNAYTLWVNHGMTRLDGGFNTSGKFNVNSSGQLTIYDNATPPANTVFIGNGTQGAFSGTPTVTSLTLTGNVPKVNNISTEGLFGVAAIVDTVEKGSQTATISATGLNGTTVDGLYEIDYYGSCTTANGTSTVSVTIDWDNATKTSTSATWSNASVNNYISGHLLVHNVPVSSSAIRWSTTVGGTIGSAKYKINVVAKRIN